MVLKFRYIHCLRSFRAFLDFEFYVITFVKILAPFSVYGFIMHKYIFSVFNSDKTVAFCPVEPFHFSFGHWGLTLLSQAPCDGREVRMRFERLVAGQKKFHKSDGSLVDVVSLNPIIDPCGRAESRAQ